MVSNLWKTQQFKCQVHNYMGIISDINFMFFVSTEWISRKKFRHGENKTQDIIINAYLYYLACFTEKVANSFKSLYNQALGNTVYN